MVKIPVALLGLVATAVHAYPILDKRIAQSISASTAKWEQSCIAAGGGQRCNPVSVASFTTLLAAAGPCEQQDAADNMIDLSKQLKSTQMVNLAQVFAQQPRNSPTSLSIPYCQKAPRNPELNGLFQCQFEGVNKQLFVPNVQLGGPGTTPFGSNSPVSPLGSCPAHPDGPVPDGQQLADITQNSGGGGGVGAKAAPAPAPASTPAQPSPSPSPAASEPSPPAPAKLPAVPADRSADGRAAQQANAKFATLSADSSCNAGEVACVQGAFAQCVSGKFVTTPCGNGATCAAVPLNRGGTVVTCTTQADAISRIQATGASGGLTG